MQEVLRQFTSTPTQARYCGGRKSLWPKPGGSQDGPLAEAVSEGRTTLVLPARSEALKLLLAFLMRHEIKDIMLTLDEGDAMLSTPITREEVESDAVIPLRNLREAYLYRLLGRLPLGKGSLVRSLLSVSHGRYPGAGARGGQQASLRWLMEGSLGVSIPHH